MTKELAAPLSELPAVDHPTWRAKVENELRGADFERALLSRMPHGGTVEPLYGEDYPSSPRTRAEDATGFPGLWPFVRGGQPLPAGGPLVCPRHDHPSARAVGAAVAVDLEGGASGILLELDRAFRLGLDPADPSAAAHRGEGGASIVDRRALAEALGEALKQNPDMEVILSAGANALPASALIMSLLEGLEKAPGSARVHVGMDPLGALARDGALPAPLSALGAEMAALTAHAREHLSAWRTIRVGTEAYHDAGAHPVAELAYALATGVQYLRWLEDTGVTAEMAAPHMDFCLPVGREVFSEVAKLRAARLLWAQALSACEAKAPMWLHATCSRRTLTERDPWVNMLRTTTQAFAAIVGGADALTGTAFDEALGQPEALGRRVARNAPTILMAESHLARVLDPTGGSYYVESLTADLAEAAWSHFQRIEQAGGMAAYLLAGSVRAEVDEAAKEQSARVDRRKAPLTGVSEFAIVAEEKLHRETGASDAAVSQSAGGTASPAEGSIDVTKPGAVSALFSAGMGATASQLSRALRRTGEPASLPPFPRRRDAASFEALRDGADGLKTRPQVFLANLGPLSEHKPRAGFAQNLLAAGGIDVVEHGGTGEAGPESAAAMLAEALGAADSEVACICGTDGRYAEMAVAVASALREAGAQRILLAGRPSDLEAPLREAGVERFIHLGCDVRGTLEWLLEGYGVELGEVK